MSAAGSKNATVPHFERTEFNQNKTVPDKIEQRIVKMQLRMQNIVNMKQRRKYKAQRISQNVTAPVFECAVAIQNATVKPSERTEDNQTNYA